MTKDISINRGAFLARVEAGRKALGWSEQRLCREAGLSTSALKNLRLRTEQTPTMKLVIALAKAMDMSPEWLAFERGQKSIDGDTGTISSDEVDHNDIDARHAAYFSADSRSVAGVVPEIDARAGAGEGAVGEVIYLSGGGISSGHAVTFEWGVPPELMRYHFGADPRRVIILPVKGDSMYPTLLDGDRVLVDLDDTVPNDGGIFLLDEGHGPIVKRARIIHGDHNLEIEIISDNASLTPLRRLAEDVRVVGRVKGRWTRI